MRKIADARGKHRDREREKIRTHIIYEMKNVCYNKIGIEIDNVVKLRSSEKKTDIKHGEY